MITSSDFGTCTLFGQKRTCVVNHPVRILSTAGVRWTGSYCLALWALECVKINLEVLGRGEQMRKDSKLEVENRLCQRLGNDEIFCSKIKSVKVSFFFHLFFFCFDGCFSKLNNSYSSEFSLNQYFTFRT